MDATSWMFCKAFLQKCAPERQSILTSYLPGEELAVLEETSAASLDAPAHPPEDLLDGIHHSWIAPFLRTLPENDIRLYLGALGGAQVKSLKKALLFSNNLPTLLPAGQQFLRDKLLSKISDEGHPLPIPYLPNSPLTPLLQLPYKDLLQVIDLLSMHDLAAEIHQIIDTSKLKKIHASLSKEQQIFLKTLSQRKEPLSFKKMALNNWDGNPEHLKLMLHQRGLNRLAKALFGEDPHMLWHLHHKLDVERASAFKKLCKPLDHPEAAAVLRSQVLHLLHSMNHSEKRETP